MNYRIRTHKVFDKEAKRLGKKYPSLKKDLIALGNGLLENPLLGVDLGNGFRKIRLTIASKGKGKSHGARVITHTQAIVNVNEQGVITLLTIYDKAERETISKRDIMVLMASLDDNDSDLL